MNSSDWLNKKFGLLTVIAIGPVRWYSGQNRQMLICSCVCGQQKEILPAMLKTGRIKSCGCNAQKARSIAQTTHALSKHPLFKTWRAMFARCYNTRHEHYARYGGRGITVCARWLELANFVADMHPRPLGLTLERKNNDAGYSPENCRWATSFEQNQNLQTNVIVKLNNQNMCLAEAGRKLNLSVGRIGKYARYHGITTQQAVDHYTKRAVVRHAGS